MMSIKKRIVHSLFVFGLTGFLLSIGFFTPEASAQTPSKDGWPKKITIAVTGGEMGPSYPILASIGRMIEKYMGVSVNLTSTGGHDATNLMNKGQVQIMAPTTQSISDILQGSGPVKSLGPTPARAWLQVQTFGVDYITLEKSGIKSFSDLKGKIVCIGPSVTTSPDKVLNALATAYGFDLKSVRVVKWDRPADAYDGLKAGKFDVIQVQGIHPASSTTELFLSSPARFLDVGNDQMAMLRKELTWLLPEIIPAGTYKGVNKDVQSPAVGMFIVTHRDLPDSFVYAMTKMVWEHFDEFSASHPSAKNFKAKDVEKIVDSCPYHNGAIKYYKEIGAWTTSTDKRQAASLNALPQSAR
jgi:TRAP transporter TAXI family solute receptor